MQEQLFLQEVSAYGQIHSGGHGAMIEKVSAY